MQEIVKPQLDSYFGHCFERIRREALATLYAQEGVRANFAIGEYWDQKHQIDHVGLRDDGRTDLGECKWTATSSSSSLRKELEPRASAYPKARQASLGHRLSPPRPTARKMAFLGGPLSGVEW